MRVAVISDLHVDNSDYNEQIVPKLVDRLVEEPFTALCVLGDISASLDTLKKTLEKFNKIKCRNKFFVPGNHDIWLADNQIRKCMYGSHKDSFFKVVQIGIACEKLGWHNLMNGPKIIDDVGFAGSMSWYDYSFRDAGLNVPMSYYQDKHCPGVGYWMDGIHAYFLNGRERARDSFVTRTFNADLEYGLEQIEGCAKKVCCTHHIPFKEFQEGMHKGGSFFNAFGGNIRLGGLLKEHKVDVSLSGHLHRNFHAKMFGIDCYQTAIGYLSEDYMFPTGKTDWDKIIDERLLFIEV